MQMFHSCGERVANFPPTENTIQLLTPLFPVSGGSLQIISIAKPPQNGMSKTSEIHTQKNQSHVPTISPDSPFKIMQLPCWAVGSSQRWPSECGGRRNVEANHTRQSPDVMRHTHVDQPQTNPGYVMWRRAASCVTKLLTSMHQRKESTASVSCKVLGYSVYTDNIQIL